MELRHLVCVRIADADQGAPYTESFIDACYRCKHAVWHAFSSPKVDRVVCDRCLEDDIAEAKSRGEKIEIGEATKEQLEDIRRSGYEIKN